MPSYNTYPISGIIAHNLRPADLKALHNLLLSCSDISDFGYRLLGEPSVVTHRNDTGDASPIHRRPNMVSRPERRVIL